MTDLVVLGAGPAGLMTALRSAQAGYQCVVLESAPVVGGMAGSFEVAGQRVDFGSHRLHPNAPPQVLELLQGLLGNDLQTRPRNGRLHLGRSWVGFPLQAPNLIRSLPATLSARLVLDAAVITARRLGPRPQPATFDDEVRARLGPTVAHEFYGPYARKLYGTDPCLLDPELAHRRISASGPGAIVRRLARARRPSGRRFLYPRLGYGQICESLADAATEAGADIRLSTPATAVVIRSDGVAVTAGGVTTAAATVASTISARSLAAIMSPPPAALVAGALDRVRTRGMVLVYLVLDSAQYTPFDAHYFPSLDTTTARLSEPKNYRDGDDPVDHTVLCAEIACDVADEMWLRNDDDLLALVLDDIGRVGLPPPAIIGCEVRRLPSVYPVYDIAGRLDRATIDAWAADAGRLVILGRQGLRVIDNIHHVLEMGTAAAASLDDGAILDPALWRPHLDRFRHHVVED